MTIRTRHSRACAGIQRVKRVHFLYFSRSPKSKISKMTVGVDFEEDGGGGDFED